MGSPCAGPGQSPGPGGGSGSRTGGPSSPWSRPSWFVASFLHPAHEGPESVAVPERPFDGLYDLFGGERPDFTLLHRYDVAELVGRDRQTALSGRFFLERGVGDDLVAQAHESAFDREVAYLQRVVLLSDAELLGRHRGVRERSQ